MKSMKPRLILCLCLLLTSLNSYASTWQVVMPESRIDFVATYDEVAFNGTFEQFDAGIKFDASELGNSKITCIIDMASVNTNSRDRDDALRDKAWFFPKKFPQAKFISQSISLQDKDTFLIEGLLEIRGIQREVTFPFTWLTDNETANVSAEFELDRRHFEIGTGDWAEDETIGFNVIVKLGLLLKKESAK